MPFLDDFALAFRSRRAWRRGRARVAALLAALGLYRKPGKGLWDQPTQVGEHLGLEIDTRLGVFRVTAKRQAKLRAGAAKLLNDAASGRRLLPARAVAQFCGLAQSCYVAMPAARLYLRSLHDDLGGPSDWSTASVRLSRQSLRDLRWWRQLKIGSADLERAFRRHPTTAVLHCDACRSLSGRGGWGGVLNRRLEAMGLWRGDECTYHISHLELIAVRKTVQAFLPLLRNRRVRLHEDNQAVVAILATWTVRSKPMMEELRRLWRLLADNDIQIEAEYITSAANEWADALSRDRGLDDWTFAPGLFDEINARWGPHSIDRFAAQHNALLPRYNSAVWDPASEAVDAFTVDWCGENNWVHPPLSLIDRAVSKIRADGAIATLAVPYWPTRPWFPRIMEMCDEYIVLSPHATAFCHALRASEAPVNARWSVMVARVRGPPPTHT